MSRLSRSTQSVTGIACIVTAVLASLPVYTFLVLQPGPDASAQHVLAFYSEQSSALKVSAALWVLAMLAFLVATTAFRDSMWADIVDRPWVTLVAVAGAVLFAVLSSIAAADGWTLASQARIDGIQPQAMIPAWEGQLAVLRLAMFTLPLPLLGYAMVLARRCPFGKFCAVLAVGVAVASVAVGPIALAGWLVWLTLTGVALIAHVDEEHVHDVRALDARQLTDSSFATSRWSVSGTPARSAGRRRRAVGHGCAGARRWPTPRRGPSRPRRT